MPVITDDYEEELIDDTCTVDEFDDEYSDAEWHIINTMKEMDEQAKNCILNFFRGKQWCCGGDIPEHELISQDKIDILEQLDLVDAVGFFYDFTSYELSKNPEFMLNGYQLSINPDYDIEVAKLILEECSSVKIPKNRAGGILLMYLDLIVGVKIDWECLAEKTREIRAIKNSESCQCQEET